jgi:hypothetical protein
MLTMFKYPLQISDGIQEVPLTAGATVQAVALQGGAIAMWAMVNSGLAIEPRRFVVVGTGRELPADMHLNRYVGMVQQGPYVWHVIELGLSAS